MSDRKDIILKTFLFIHRALRHPTLVHQSLKYKATTVMSQYQFLVLLAQKYVAILNIKLPSKSILFRVQWVLREKLVRWVFPVHLVLLVHQVPLARKVFLVLLVHVYVL